MVSCEAFCMIYGTDDRQQIREVSPQIQNLAKSVGVLLRKSQLYGPDGDGMYHLKFTELRLCPAEPFFAEPSLSPFACTVGKTSLQRAVTAGHCLETERACKSSAIVFNLHSDRFKKQGDSILIPQDQVYFCRQIVDRQYGRARQVIDEKTYYREVGEAVDYSYFELDRPAYSVPNLKISKKKGPSVGDKVFSLGYPDGLAMKYSGLGKVSSVPYLKSFYTNLDVLYGNSGGPVFDLQNREVIGLVHNGVHDEYLQTPLGCFVSARPSEHSLGERIVNMRPLLRLAYQDDLFKEASRGRLAEIRSLVYQRNVDVTVRNQMGETPLMLAMRGNHPEVVRFLLSLNSDVNIQNTKGHDAPYLAVANNNVEAMEVFAKLVSRSLFRYGKRYSSGKTLLEIAEILENQEMIALLKQKKNL